MDIDELKSVWKKVGDQNRPGYWVSEDDIRTIVKKKSQVAIAEASRQVKQKKRMTLLIGLPTLILSLVHLAGLWPANEGSLLEFAHGPAYGFVLLIMSCCILFIHIKSRKRYAEMKALETSSDPLQGTLKRNREIIRGVIRTGVMSDMIVTPLVLVFAMAFSFYKDQAFAWDFRLLILAITMAITPFIFQRLARFLMHRRFGRYVKALDDRLSELEAISAEEE